MRKHAKTRVRRAAAWSALLSVPLALSACKLVLGQGGIRLDEQGEASQPSPTPAATATGSTGSGGQSLSHPSATPTPACAPQVTVTSIDPSDPTLQSVNADVASIEGARPTVRDLRRRIVAYAGQFGLSSADLRAFAEGLLAKSASQTAVPAPEPEPEGSPAPGPAASSVPSPLHPTILAFAVHSRATQFAQQSRELGLSASQSKAFADGMLQSASPTPAEAFAAYVKYYHFAVDSRGLALGSSDAKALTDRIFQLPSGALLALTYIDVFGREVDYGSAATTASATAERAICLPPAAPATAPSPAPAPPARS